MKVYSLVWFNQGIQDYDLGDHLEDQGTADLYSTLEKAKEAAEQYALDKYAENLEWEKELQGGDDFESLPEPKFEWKESSERLGDFYMLDPWNLRRQHVGEWSPGWWAIREIEVG